MLATRIFPTISILGFLFYAMADNIYFFIDTRIMFIVLGSAIAYGVSGAGEWNSQDRLIKFSQGAVLFGWLGALIGAVLVSGGIDDINNVGPAISLTLLALVYGYIIKAVVGIFLTEE